MSTMLRMRKHIESLFERAGHGMYRNRVKCLVLVAIVVGVLAAQMPNLEVDMSEESLLRKDDPIRIDFDNFREEFGSDGMIVIAITPPEVFDAEFLTRLFTFHDAVEQEIPYLKDVASLINARHTYGDGDMLVVEDLLEGWPKHDINLAALRAQALSNPVYVNNLVSEDGRVTTVVIETEVTVSQQSEADILADFDEEIAGVDADASGFRALGSAEIDEIMHALQTVIDRYQSPDFEIAFAGTPVQFNVLEKTMMQDVRKNISLVVLIIALTLALFFRRISGVVLPLVVVSLSAVSTIGVMALLRIPFTMPSQIIPQFLMAVGIGDAIHVLAIFYKRFQEGHTREDAIAYALGHSGLAVVMTSLTTAAGLLSFAFADLAPIAAMGIACAIGVMLALLYTIVLLPSALALMPIVRKQPPARVRAGGRMDRILSGFGRLSARHPYKILGVSLLLAAVSLYFVPNIRFSHDVLAWMPDTLKVKQDVQMIDRELNGATTLEVIVDTGVENGLYNPAILQHLETLARSIETMRDGIPAVGAVFSLNDLLKETNQALHENDPAYYTIPDEHDLIAQELFLFENSGADDLEKLVDSQFSKTRVTIKTAWAEAVQYGQFVETIKALFHKEFAGQDVAITFTGVVPVMARAVPASINSAVKSYIIAILVIALMMVAIVGGWRIGLLSMLPNFLPIIMVLGFMGLAGIPMDMMSILIGSIALGLVVDDTVHFIYNFRKYFHETADSRQAVELTFLGTGRALLITSVVLSSGFIVAVTATMINIQRFGLLVTMTIVLALLADFMLSPTLLVLFVKPENAKQPVPTPAGGTLQQGS